MKNYRKLLLTGILISLIIVSCKQCNTPKINNDEYNNVNINPEFKTNPPIAQNINVSLLDNETDQGSILFEATLPKEKIKSQFHAVMITDENKVVLHDDGKNGDKQANDGVYSIVLKDSPEHLQAYFQEQQQKLAKLKAANTSLVRFIGRSLVNDCTMVPVNRQFDLRKGVSIVDIPHIPLFIPVDETLKHNSLMVTAPSVVTDPSRTFDPCTSTGTPGGAWTFGHLITEMTNSGATGITPENFLLNWLTSWQSLHSVNGDDLAARTNITTIINDWHTLCGGSGAPLDVNKAPFKLLAIVNRFDLKGISGYGGGNAGEGRFVFCATNSACVPRFPLPFLVIFEYGVNKKTCTTIRNYAQQWTDLAGITLGSPGYNAALQAITDQFVLRNTNPAKPNGSSLNQIRTNEIALAGPWELREFNIDASSHFLINVTTKREPQIPYNSLGGAADVAKINAFGDFVNANEPTVTADQMDIPESLLIGGVLTPFLGAKAHTLNPTTFHWDATTSTASPGFITSFDARHHISLNTCSGCHGGETNTGNFTHVGLPFNPATGATLSKFLTGDPPFSGTPFVVTDRANRPPPTPHDWEFNDLERRGRFLSDFLSIPCFKIFPFPILKKEEFRFTPPMSIVLAEILTETPLTMTH
jgi:hypothetical protein